MLLQEYKRQVLGDSYGLEKMHKTINASKNKEKFNLLLVE